MVNPEIMMNEIAETLLRLDIEPKFFTFHSFADMGQETFKKLTKVSFTTNLDLKDGHYDYA